jgi:hypothetical protein
MLPGLSYSAQFENISVTAAAQDIFELVCPAARGAYIWLINLTCGTTSQEIGRLQLIKRTTTGSGGSAITPRALNRYNTIASAMTSFTRTVTTPGTGTDVYATAQWNIVVPFEFGPKTPDAAGGILVPAGERIGLHLPAALGGARNMSLTVCWDE